MTSDDRRKARYQRRVKMRQERRNKRSHECGNFDEVFSYRNLFKSGLICCKNVGWKCSTQRYRALIVSNTAKTRKALLNGIFKSKGFYEFDLMERGKLRHIRSIHISERTVQRNLCDHVITPVFQASFIYDNGASTKFKGIDFALNRFECHLHRHFRKHGLNGGVLVFDFSNYFGSAPHKPIHSEFARRIHDRRIRKYAGDFIENFGSEGFGLGSQISQNAALMLPNKLDHVIKQELKIKGYARYMDDGYLIHENIGHLQHCLKRMNDVCNELGITLNHKKTKIIPIRHGIVFLKTKFILTESGKVYRKMSRDSMKAMKRKLRKFKKWVDSGKFTLEDVRCSYESCRGHLRRGDCYRALLKIDQYFQRLYGFHPNDKTKWRDTNVQNRQRYDYIGLCRISELCNESGE